MSACPRSARGAAVGGSPVGVHDVGEAVRGIGPRPLGVGSVAGSAQAGDGLLTAARGIVFDEGEAAAAPPVRKRGVHVRRSQPRFEAGAKENIVEISGNQIHGMARVRLEALVCPGESFQQRVRRE